MPYKIRRIVDNTNAELEALKDEETLDSQVARFKVEENEIVFQNIGGGGLLPPCP